MPRSWHQHEDASQGRPFVLSEYQRYKYGVGSLFVCRDSCSSCSCCAGWVNPIVVPYTDCGWANRVHPIPCNTMLGHLIVGVYMPSDAVITNVHGGMRMISADGIYIGKIWRIYFRDAESCIEIRPHSFWNVLLDALVLRPMPNSSHLFISGHTITRIVSKRVHVRLDAKAARACVNMPPWIEREKIPPTGFNRGRLD